MFIDSNGKLGIGTTNPSSKVDCFVTGDRARFHRQGINTSSSGTSHIELYISDTINGPGAAILFHSPGSWWKKIFADSAAFRMLDGGTANYVDLYVQNLFAIGNVTAYASDKRLKTNITPLQNPLDTIKKLNGYRYVWRDDIDGLTMSGPDIGLLAQDLEDAGLHECITLAPFDNDGGVSKSGNEYKTVHYNKLHALWAAALKEQQGIIESLLDRVAALESKLENA
jgi:hypothetical protein